MRDIIHIRKLGGRRRFMQNNYEVHRGLYVETRTITKWGAKLEARRIRRALVRTADSKEIWREDV